MKVDFFLGRHKLKMLFLQCKAELLNKQEWKSPEFVPMGKSGFGNWLKLELFKKYSNLEELSTLAEKNENFHIYAKKVLTDKPKDIKRITEHITSLQQMADEMELLLVEVENKIN